MNENPNVSIILPCLNEEETVGGCIRKIQEVLRNAGIVGEIIVVDNGSSDGSAAISGEAGARVVQHAPRGYGSASREGLDQARGEILIMADADGTYDFFEIPNFIRAHREQGAEFVSGTRFSRPSDSLNNPWLHRVFGNPFLTGLVNFFFRARYTDVYCGFRSFKREVYPRIRPISNGMEFNLELAIRVASQSLKIAEIPIFLGPRKGRSKLRTLRDGLGSLKLILFFALREKTAQKHSA